MGFDIYGINAINKKGEYFRNNVWWYRGLHAFLLMTCDDILTDEDLEAMNYNNGHRIGKVKTKKLVKRLDEILADKPKYDRLLEQIQRALNERPELDSIKKTPDEIIYPVSWKNIEEFHEFIKNNNGFEVS